MCAEILISTDKFTRMNTKQQLRVTDFFAGHPVFPLDEAVAALAAGGERPGVVDRLKYHIKTGQLKRVAREIYAVVPPAVPVEDFRPDPPPTLFIHGGA